MFALRIIEEERVDDSSKFHEVIENFELGNSYSVITKGKTDEFDELIKDDFPNGEMDETAETVRAIVCGENGVHFWVQHDTPKYKYAYFIMTESGKTFEKL